MSQSQWKKVWGRFFRKNTSVQRGVAYHRSRLSLERLEVRINPQVTVTGPTTFTAGTRILISATLTSSDENEDGEGEALIVTLNGSNYITDTSYNTTVPYTHLVTGLVEVFGANLNGEDGDETGTVTISVDTTTPKFTDMEKAAFNKIAAGYNDAAANWAIAAGLLGTATGALAIGAVVSSPTVIGGVTFAGASAGAATLTGAAATISGGYWKLNAIYGKLAADPPDPNFTTVAQPVVQQVTLSLNPPDPSTAPQLAALQAVITNQQMEIADGNALVTAVNRYSGAVQAGDTVSEALQQAAINTFGADLASVLSEQPALDTAAQAAAMTLDGYATMTSMPSDVLAFETTTATSGLPMNIQQVLSLEGASATDITDFTNLAFAQDTTAASGNPFDTLTDSNSSITMQTIQADVQSEANMLVASSLSLSQSSITVNPATIPAATGTATVTLQVFDSSGNKETTGGLNVTFGVAPGSASGTFGPVTDNGNGTYTDVFTAGSTNGSASITGTIASQPVTSTSPVVNIGHSADELGEYRASDGSWSLDSDGTTGFGPNDQVFFSFSPANVTGVVGDWTGAGHTNIGDFSNGVWHLDLNGNGVLDANETFNFGQAGDQPVVGDWDGNPSGRSELGVFRANPDGSGSGQFILDTNNDRVIDAGDTTFTFGLATDKIIVGDWTGTGKTKVGVYRDAKDFNPADAGDIVFSENTSDTDTTVFTSFVFGLITDKVVIGDWNGSGTAKVAVYRDASTVTPTSNPLYAPGTAIFSEDYSGALDFSKDGKIFLFGLSTDQFVSGHWALTPPLQPNGLAQFAANGPGSGGASPLTEAQLEPVLQQAMAAWAADGANVAQLEAARVQIGTLDDNLVGETSGNQITLDATADGWGWNTDTSGTDFTSAGPDGLQATPGSAAAGEMDLLTVVEHEYGHILGMADVNPLTQPGSLMASTLPVGVRRSPTTVADAVFASGSVTPQ